MKQRITCKVYEFSIIQLIHPISEEKVLNDSLNYNRLVKNLPPIKINRGENSKIPSSSPLYFLNAPCTLYLFFFPCIHHGLEVVHGRSRKEKTYKTQKGGQPSCLLHVFFPLNYIVLPSLYSDGRGFNNLCFF